MTKAGQTWRLEYYRDGVKQKNITVIAASRNEADELAQAEKRRRLTGPAQDVSGGTLGDLVDRYLAAHLPTVRAANTKRQYLYVRKHYLAEFGKRPLADLTSLDLNDFRDDMLAGGLSAVTVILVLKLIKATFTWACGQVPPVLERNISAPLKMPVRPASPREHFTFEEGMRMLAAAEAPTKACLALGMLGLRRGEVMALRRSDVDNANTDPEARVVKVNKKFVYQNRGFILEPPKYGICREVAIPEEFQAIFAEHKEWSLGRHNLTDLMFVSPKDAGRPIHLELPARWVRDACEKAGIDRRGRDFHSLRHSFVIWNRDQGIQDRDIAHAGGWANTIQIQKLYGNHPNEKRNQLMKAAFSRAVAAARSATPAPAEVAV